MGIHILSLWINFWPESPIIKKKENEKLENTKEKE